MNITNRDALLKCPTPTCSWGSPADERQLYSEQKTRTHYDITLRSHS